MKNSRLVIALCAIVMMLGSVACGVVYNKDSYLKEYEGFITRIEGISSFTEAEWAEIKLEYAKYNEEYYAKYKPELTESDMQTLGRLQGRFIKVQARHSLDTMDKTVEDALNQAAGLIDELLN